MKRPYHKTSTTKEQHSHDQLQQLLEDEELADICTAAKHLDKSIICDKLLNHGQLQKYRRAGKDALVPSSMLALRLLRKVRHSLEITTTTTTAAAASTTRTRYFRGGKKRKRKAIYTDDDDNDDGNEEKIQDTVECGALMLRAMLLLPSCSSSPWDAIKMFVKLLLDRKQGSEGASHSKSIIGQKTVIDIKVFYLAFFKNGGIIIITMKMTRDVSIL
jgi:hypothetical protein